ncbi:MAG: 30S ribosomal protein S2, partial [Chitinophagaceae bacterium]|nr:30S ribosomal protein S2 [Chitinophagaceae bacterium]
SKDKMEKVLGGISQMSRVPAALFIVDISHEHIALAEAKRLGIATIAMVDTNSDPSKVDFAVPSNDDATKSIAIITNYLTAAIMEGLQERSQAKENGEEETDVEEVATRGMDINEDDDKSERRGRGRGTAAGPGGAAGGAGRPRTGGPGRPASGSRGPGGGGTRPGGSR